MKLVRCPQCGKMMHGVFNPVRESILMHLLKYQNFERSEFISPKEVTTHGIAAETKIPISVVYKAMGELSL